MTTALNLHVASPSNADYLGPATVLRVDPASMLVELPSGEVVTARSALAVAYEPAEGDLLLVIGKGADHYVIGVLEGAGKSTLTMAGDVELRAAGGTLRLTGDRGIELRSPQVEVATGKLHVIAEAAIQRFASLCQQVTHLLSVRAGEAHTVVEGTQVNQARVTTMLTEEVMTLNGKQIHLG